MKDGVSAEKGAEQLQKRTPSVDENSYLVDI